MAHKMKPRPVRHLAMRMLGRYPIVMKRGGEKWITEDHYHPAVARTLAGIHQAGLDAVEEAAKKKTDLWGPNYLRGAAQRVSELDRESIIGTLNVPARLRNNALYKAPGDVVPLSRAIRKKALTRTEKAVLLARAMHNNGNPAKVVLGIVNDKKKTFVRLQGYYADPTSGKLLKADDPRFADVSWTTIHDPKKPMRRRLIKIEW